MDSKSLNLTVPLACLSIFLIVQLMQSISRVEELKTELKTTQIKLERGDQMIDKLRGFSN